MTGLSMRTFLSICLMVLLAACGEDADLEQIVFERENESTIVYVKDDKVLLQIASQEAIDTLPVFWDYFSKSKSNNELSDFVLKVKLVRTDGGLEHVWVSRLVHKSGLISGQLDNRPSDAVPDYNKGDTIEFPVSDISDWAFFQSGKMRGHFTSRIILDEADTDFAKEFFSKLHESPVP